MLEPGRLGKNRSDLASILRTLRKEAGYTGKRLGSETSMSQSRVSKIENGKLTPTVVDVQRILEALDVPAEDRPEILALAKLANTEYRDVRSLLQKGLDKRQNELEGLEQSSRQLRYFLPVMITALLATPEYVRASLSHSSGDTTKAVARKLERQAVLYDETKEFTFVLTEAAIRWAVLPAPLMALQVDRLISLSHLSNIRLGVIPLGVESARGPMNTFTVYDRRLVTAELFSGSMALRDPRDIDFHLGLFAGFESIAVFGGAARDYLSAWTQAFRA
ncbi:helix-turn-helix domain-containing protein [Actinomadura atramentaria]|uniref:helix-turn-helix domain-containing protein n=1 Tax=Actinomadura atramentaria TaxID=1990 RepID=UPI000375382D|nr:helix-turn-helix transcriptional regulator [Actinomadura atramentaria]